MTNFVFDLSYALQRDSYGLMGATRAKRSLNERVRHKTKNVRSKALRRSLLAGFSLCVFGQAADGQVVHHLLDLLHVVLEAVVAFPQRVVF